VGKVTGVRLAGSTVAALISVMDLSSLPVTRLTRDSSYP
jgi:hypothetical protein